MSIEKRIQRIEDILEIQQLPVRYAMAVDDRDIDAWVELFVPDVRVGKDSYGRDALRTAISRMTRTFYRSVHQIVGHRVEVVDDEHAVGNVYCRAEHEVGERWVVMAIRYDDAYRKVQGRWHFDRRQERHWYAVDHLERPQQVAFASWRQAGQANLPASDAWLEFWSDGGAEGLTTFPVSAAGRGDGG